MILENLSDINRELRVNIPQNVYLLYGPDAYLKDRYLGQITKMVLPEGSTMLNHYRITEKTIDPVKLEELIYQIPFGGRILVVVNDLTITSQSDKEIESICQLIGEVGEGVILALVVREGEFEDKKSAKAKKLLKAVDQNGVVFKLGFSKRSELADFVRNRIERGGASIEMETVYTLLDYCGEGLDLLLHEAEKLSHYANGEKITEEMILRVCSPTIEGNIYLISRKMLAGEPKGVMQEIDNLIYNRVDPIRIVTTLGYTFGDLLTIKLGMEQGKNAAEMKTALKLRAPESVLANQMRDIRRISLTKIRRCAELILEGEYTLKTLSGDSRIVLERLVTEVMSCIIG